MKKILTISALTLTLTLLATSCSETVINEDKSLLIEQGNRDYLISLIKEDNKTENLEINFLDEKVYENVYIRKEERQTDIYYYLIQTFEPDDIAPFHEEFECYLTYNEDTELRNIYEVNDHFNK